MAYIKTTWEDGENKYSITDQAGNVIPGFENIKLLYTGAGGTPLSAEKMNKIEVGIENAAQSMAVTGTDLLAWAAAQTRGGYFSITNTITVGVPATSWYNGFLEVPFAGGQKITLTQRTSPFKTYTNTYSGGAWAGWTEIAPIATQAEASLGASLSKIITPVTLKGVTTTIITASDNLRASADTELSISNQSVWVKMKAFTIATSGTYRVKFAIRESSMAIIYGRIYKNGVAYGTERSTTSGILTFSEDLVFSAGDTCELWIKGGGAGTGYCSNFRIYFDTAYAINFSITPDIPALTYGS